MRRHHIFRHCFVRVGFHAADESALLQFTAGEFYTYHPMTQATWDNVKATWGTGTLFNANWRRIMAIGYVAGDSTTTAETDSF